MKTENGNVLFRFIALIMGLVLVIITVYFRHMLYFDIFLILAAVMWLIVAFWLFFSDVDEQASKEKVIFSETIEEETITEDSDGSDDQNNSTTWRIKRKRRGDNKKGMLDRIFDGEV